MISIYVGKYLRQTQSLRRGTETLPFSGSNRLPFAIVLRKDASARLNDPSASVFILLMSDCKVVSFVAMSICGQDFDALGIANEEKKDK